MQIVANIALFLFIGLMILATVGAIFPKIGHAIFGWHHVRHTSGFDGASLHGRCVICDKDCMQDSQGNWF